MGLVKVYDFVPKIKVYKDALTAFEGRKYLELSIVYFTLKIKSGELEFFCIFSTALGTFNVPGTVLGDAE